MSVPGGISVEWVKDFLVRHLESRGGNFVDRAVALTPEAQLMKMFERVAVGVADAKDDYFEKCREDEVVGSHFRMPREWLPGAKSVISVFFAFTDRVVESNSTGADLPSIEWLHARIEGQKYINSLMTSLKSELEREGYQSVVPSVDSRFLSVNDSKGERRFSGKAFTSFWSERHVAYACGLGTFGLSKGIITELGAAGRLASIVTALELPASERNYTGVYDYCSMCGVCADRCPAGAIDAESGKDHGKCSAFLDGTLKRFAPRYGCGKCQTAVPCQREVPWA